jgi:hypothetical protein
MYVAKKALKKVNQVSKAQEIKHYDLNFLGPFNLDWFGTAISMNVGIPQGLLDTNRIGDTIYCLGIRVKFVLDINTADRAMCRFILIWDKEDSISTADEMLSATGSVNVINSPFIVDDRHRYIVLRDKVVKLNNGDHRIRQVTMSKKLNKKTQFEAATTDVTKGRLKLFLFSNIDATDASRPFIQGWSRLWYKDS